MYATSLNLAKVNLKLRRDARPFYFFSQLTGEAKYKGSQKWSLSGNPIEHFADFDTQSTGNSLRVQMLKKLSGVGFTGSQTMLSNEQQLQFFNMTLYIHLKRQGAQLPTEVDMQKIGWMGIATMVQPELSEWLGMYQNTDVSAAILEGYSRHITASSPGLAVSKVLPYNFWVWDGGNNDFSTNSPAAYSYTYATERGYWITAFETLETGRATDKFDLDTLIQIKAAASRAQIKPFQGKRGQYYALIIHPLQEASLLSDTRFLDANAQGMPRGEEGNPLFKDCVYTWKNIVIFVDGVVSRLPYYNGSTLNFFDYSAGSEMVTSTTNENQSMEEQERGTDQSVALAYLLGESCIGYTTYGKPEFTGEDTDHKMVKSVGIQAWWGFNRMDYVNELTVTSTTEQSKPQLAVIATAV